MGQNGTQGKSGTCFSFSFLFPCLPNKPATKLFLRLATLVFLGLGVSPTGVVSSTLAGGVISPANGDVLMFERDYDQVSSAEALGVLRDSTNLDAQPLPPREIRGLVLVNNAHGTVTIRLLIQRLCQSSPIERHILIQHGDETYQASRRRHA